MPEGSGLGLGTAPIGHRVTVVTAEEVAVDIKATVVMKSGFVIEQIKKTVNDSLTNYLQTVKEEWEANDTLWIFIARISMTILSITGVANVHSITINGQPNDFELSQDKYIQKIPTLGEVILINA